MFSRIIGLIAVIVLSYVLCIFALPNIADQYGDPVLNAKIRSIKDTSLQFASGSDSATSLIEKVRNTTTPYIEDTKKTVQDINTTVANKINQVQDAAIAVEGAYSGIIDATHKIQNLTGTGR